MTPLTQARATIHSRPRIRGALAGQEEQEDLEELAAATVGQPWEGMGRTAQLESSCLEMPTGSSACH